MIRHLTKPSVDHQNSPSTINFYQLFADDLAGGMSIGSTGGQAAKGGKLERSAAAVWRLLQNNRGSSGGQG